MSTDPTTPIGETDYVWELATLYPAQGAWTENEYFDLTDRTNGRVEFTAGRLEFLTMPTEIHEALVQFLFLALHCFVDAEKSGVVYSSGIRVRVTRDRVRLPDVVFLQTDHFNVRHNQVWDGADLVMEVVSNDPKDRKRDFEDKRIDYAAAGIAEYWIIDFQQQSVIVHELQNGEYGNCREFKNGQQADSLLLNGFQIDVSALFLVASDIPD